MIGVGNKLVVENMQTIDAGPFIELTLEQYRLEQKSRKRNIVQIIVDGVEYFFLWLFSKINMTKCINFQ